MQESGRDSRQPVCYFAFYHHMDGNTQQKIKNIYIKSENRLYPNCEWMHICSATENSAPVTSHTESVFVSYCDTVWLRIQ